MPDVQLATIGGATATWDNTGGPAPRLGPWVINGVIYFMVVSTVAGTNRITVNYSSDNGATWTAATPLVAATLGKLTINDCNFAKDTYLDRIYAVIHTNGNIASAAILVWYFDTATLAWVALSSQPVVTRPDNPCNPGTVAAFSNISDIVINSSTGDLTIGYGWATSPAYFCVPSGNCGSFLRVCFSDYLSGVWGAQTTIPGQETVPFTGRLGTDLYLSQILRSSNGRLHFFIHQLDNTGCSGDTPAAQCPLYHISRASDGVTWGSLQTIISDSPQMYAAAPWSFGQGIITGGEIIIPYMSGSRGASSLLVTGMVQNALHATDADVPVWTAKVVDATISGGDDRFIPGYRSGQVQEITASIGDADGTISMYYVVVTSINATFPFSGDIRQSIYSGGVWQAFSTYRTFAIDHVPTGVYAYNSTAALYLRVAGGTGIVDQTNTIHFLGELIFNPPTLACPLVGAGSVNVAFSSFLIASGGTPPYTFTIFSGSLPPGLTLNASTGEISGVPTLAGVFSYTARVTDAAAQTADATCSITITKIIGHGGRAFIKIRLNLFDACLGRDYKLYERIDRTLLSCGIKPLCFCIDEREWGTTNDDDEMIPGAPGGSLAFNPSGQIALPTTLSGDNVIFEFRVPIGYDGVILGQFHGYYQNPVGPVIPPNYVEGSGDIVWRLASNGRYVRDCGAMLVTLGTIRSQSPIAGGIHLKSQDLVQYIVNVPNTSGTLSPGQGSILAGLHGYFWPRK